jgi:tetratricopeptide (TPR) repeat protein
LGQLRPAHRPEYAVAVREIWQRAGELTHDRDLATRATAWVAEDPDLPLVKRLLAVLQFIETGGWVELGDAGLRAMLGMLPPVQTTTDPRPAYVLANRGRALRLLGRHAEACRAFEAAQQCARRLGEEWLDYRADMGLAVIHEERGNFPAARERYLRVLSRYDDGSPIAQGARQGLFSVARSTGRYDEAFDHAWHAFREAGRNRELRIEALTHLGELCRRVGRFQAALRACEAALALQPPARYVAALHGTAMKAAESLRLFSVADDHAAVIMHLMSESGYHTYALADVWRDLALWHAARDETFGGRSEDARSCAHRAQELAAHHGYHEITFEMDDLIARLDGAVARPTQLSPLGTTAERIVTDVAALPLAGELLLAMK